MANRLIYPYPMYPVIGDVDSMPGSNRLTVVGLQTTPMLGTAPINGDFLVYQSIFSPNLNEWIPTAWGILKSVVTPSVSPTGVLTIDASLANSFRIIVNQVISSSSIINANTDGQQLVLLFVQDGTGHSVSLPGNVIISTAIGTTANSVTCVPITYDSTLGNWYEMPYPISAGGGGSVTSVSCGNLSPIFTASVANPTTTPAISFSLAAFTDGQLLIGDSSTGGLDKATLTAGTGISVTNGHGTITIAATGTLPNFVTNEVVSFSGTSGTLAHTPVSGSQAGYRNGSRMQPGAGNDYTISGATITLSVAAGGSDVFLFDYRY